MKDKLLALVVAALCAVVVVGYQSSRPSRAAGDARVFVPSPTFYEKLSPSFRTSVADAYYLAAIQYYGEHLETDQRYDALPAMLDLVTTLSPRFKEPYFFGSFALLDYGDAQKAYDLLKSGFAASPDDWHFPFYLGFFAYRFGGPKTRDKVAADWYSQAARLPGAPPTMASIAAALYTKGDARGKAVVMWAQVYGEGDKYAREKAVRALDELLPADAAGRQRTLALLRPYMPPDRYNQLVLELLGGS